MPGIAPKRMFIPAAAVLVLMASLAHVGWRGASAATITVNTAVDETIANGQCSLREAITNANNNAATFPDCAQGSGADTISFQSGLSSPITLASSQLPIITDALTINGPGAGVLTVSGNTIFRVFEVGAGVSASISGLTIANGITIASGGGVFNAGTLILANCTISSSIGIGGGGGIGNTGTLTLTNTTVTNNSVASGSGGGIRNEGSLTLTNSTISGNAAADFGGGIFSSGSVTLTSSTVSGNTGTNGGGIYMQASTLALVNSTVSGNNASVAVGGGFGGVGGGIFSFGVVTLSNSTVSGNTATSVGAGGAGGGVYTTGTLTLTNSTVSSNNAVSLSIGGIGGGISNVGTLTLTNSTISGNTAASLGFGGSGGGIDNDSSGTLSLTNSTISGNSADGVANRGNMTLVNTIIADQQLGPNCSGFGVGVITSGGNNLDSDGTCSLSQPSDIPNGSANLGPLASNGGPTQTRALLSGSEALDAGSNAVCAAPPVNNLDQRGFPRPQDGDGNSTAICDIGAFERQQITTPPPTPTAAGTASPSPTTTATRTVTPTATGTFPSTATPLATRTPFVPIVQGRPPALGAFPLAGATGTERNLALATAQAAGAAPASSGIAIEPGAAGASLLRPPNTGDAGLVQIAEP